LKRKLRVNAVSLNGLGHFNKGSLIAFLRFRLDRKAGFVFGDREARAGLEVVNKCVHDIAQLGMSVAVERGLALGVALLASETQNGLHVALHVWLVDGSQHVESSDNIIAGYLAKHGVLSHKGFCLRFDWSLLAAVYTVRMAHHVWRSSEKPPTRTGGGVELAHSLGPVYGN